MARSLVRWWALSNPSIPLTPLHLFKLHRTHKPLFFPLTTKTTKAFSFSTVNNNSSSSDIVNYLRLTDDELMSQCDMGTFKASGPGGQHRNKRESAVRLKHLPTGIIAQAVEDRSQHKNRASAVSRLRTLLAIKAQMT